MLWTSMIGVVFMLLVLFFGQEWWSSSRGILRDKQREAEREAEREKNRAQQKDPSKPGG